MLLSRVTTVCHVEGCKNRVEQVGDALCFACVMEFNELCARLWWANHNLRTEPE